MNLLIDIGNSSVKWAIGQGKQCHFKGFVNHKNGQPTTPFHEIFKDISQVSSVWLSNVAGDAIEHTLSAWIKQQGHTELHHVKTEKTHKNGLINGYDHPEKLGVDRWLAMVAAKQTHQTACCIIDCGTAITLDLIEHTGKHLGGLIFPGLDLMRSSLTEHTAQCAADETLFLPEDTLLATNTQDAIANASVFAAVSFIEAAVKKVTPLARNKLTCLLSGGHAEALQESLSLNCEFEPHLVLEGLNICANSLT